MVRNTWLCVAVCALLVVATYASELSSQESDGSSCAGVRPAGVQDCVDGYWLVNSSLSLGVDGYDIEGRIRIQGDFNLTAEGLLNWRGFAKSNDSFPSEVPTVSSFVLAFVNVTGNASLEGNIFVAITPENVDGIIGAIDTNNPTRTVQQSIFESANMPSGIHLDITAVKPSQSCRKVAMSPGADSSTGRVTLSALFSIDDSGCKTSKDTKLIKILVPIFVIVVVLAVVAIVIGIYKSPNLRRRFMPFASRKAGQRQGSITRYSTEPAMGMGALDDSDDAVAPLKNGKRETK